MPYNLCVGFSQVRIRALSIAEKIFRISEAAALAVQQSGVLRLLVVELDNRNDILAQINALELLQAVGIVASMVESVPFS